MTGRELLGVAGLAAGWLTIGSLILGALGVIRTASEALRGAGLALVAGWAATGIVASFGLVAGAPLGWTTILGGWAGLAVAAAVAIAARRGSGAPGPLAGRPAGAAGTLALVALAGYLLALAGPALAPRGVLHADAWSQWLLKAKTLYHLGGLDTDADGYTRQAQPDYPPLDPALEAIAFRFVGSSETTALPFLHWIVAIGFVGALGFLLRRRVPPALLWPSLLVLVLAPRFGDLVGSSLADEPVMLLLGLGAAAGGLWLLDGRRHDAALAALFLAAAALTKNEGFALSLILATLLALAARRRAGLLVVAAPLLAYAPWRAWTRLHDVPANFGYDFARLAQPDVLADRLGFLGYGVRSLLVHLFAPSEWLLIVPLALALAVAAAPRARQLSVVAVAFPAASLALYSLVYWAGNGVCTWRPSEPCDGTWRDIEWLVDPSAERIVAPVVVALAALVPLLLTESRLLAAPSESVEDVARARIDDG